MSKITTIFKLAKTLALKNSSNKNYKLGAIGIRTDGTIVCSSNIRVKNHTPAAHAEARVVKKLNKGSVVYVVRVNNGGGMLLAKPCKDCFLALKNQGIKRCYYSINNNSFGVIDF